MSNENNSYILRNGVNRVSPVSFAWPEWVSQPAAIAPIEPLTATPESDCDELSETQLDSATLFDGAQQDTAADAWDWFDHISASDRDYLLGPRTEWRDVPCSWCHRRGPHTADCDQMHDEWSMPMPFGRHKGKPIRRIEREYLEWLLGKVYLVADLRAEIERVLGVERIEASEATP